MIDNLTLVSHHLCPYVQRAAVALAEKGVPFERVMIDLSSKPDWFTAISPLGKVPLLQVRHDGMETVIFESAVILEFLEETQPNPLHPADPYERARHRAWIEFGSAMLNGIGRFYSAATGAALRAEAENLAAMFDRIESELAKRTDGPWFAGKRFALVDAVFAPIFRYFEVFDRIGDFAILADKPRVAAWRDTLAERPSVVGAVSRDYKQHLMRFLQAKDSQLAARIRKQAPAMALP